MAWPWRYDNHFPGFNRYCITDIVPTKHCRPDFLSVFDNYQLTLAFDSLTFFLGELPVSRAVCEAAHSDSELY